MLWENGDSPGPAAAAANREDLPIPPDQGELLRPIDGDGGVWDAGAAGLALEPGFFRNESYKHITRTYSVSLYIQTKIS